MIDKPSHQGFAGSRKFIPQVKPLESRLLLSRSQSVSFPDGATVVFPTFVNLPRTGGAFAQDGKRVEHWRRPAHDQQRPGDRRRQRRRDGGMEWTASPRALGRRFDRDPNAESQQRSGHDQPDIAQDQSGCRRGWLARAVGCRPGERGRSLRRNERSQNERFRRPVRLGPDRHRHPVHHQQRADLQRGRGHRPCEMERRRRPLVHGC